ncbi:hypothetical protein D3C78_1867560 [compost metagenome]
MPTRKTKRIGLEPKKAKVPSATMMKGTEAMASANPMMVLSIQPPKCAATMPRLVPMVAQMMDPASAIISDV